MSAIVTTIIVLAALLSGLALGFLLGDRKGRQAGEDKIKAAEAKLEAAEARLEDRVNRARAQVRQEDQENFGALMQEMEKRHKESADQMNARFQETIALMKEEVQNSTRQLLRDRQTEFAAMSQEKLNSIMEPLNRNIASMQEAVKENTLKNTGFNGELQQGIKSVLEQSLKAKESADKLVSALTLSNKGQGNWGERILTELLESTGMKEGIHFHTQEFIQENGRRVLGEAGSGLQPDVILHIEKGHDVVVDSKVSLKAFFNFNDAETPVERDKYLGEHISSLKKHVKELAGKDYAKHLTGALDYVIMFVPITQALYVATQKDPSLWREAMEQRVYIADEQTLFAALKIIDLNWRQQAQADNHAQIFKLADEMLDRIRQFVEHMQKMGKALDGAQKSYNDAYQKLSEGQQSIAKTCRKLTDLGAKYDKKNGPMTALLEKED